MNRYEVTANLGEGTYGQVMKARVKATGEFVAIKKFKEEDDANTMREVNILRMLKDSEYIVRLHEMFRRGGRLHLVFEFAGDNLLQVLEASRGGVDVPTVKTFMRNTLRALEVCHSRNIIHRDLKPENLLVMQRNGAPFVKLCDFGCSRKSRPGATDLTDYVATRWYRSPELLCGLPDYGTPMDIWAVGCIAAELVTSHPLFPGANESDTLAHVRRILGELPKVQLAAMQRRFEGVRLAPPASQCMIRKVHGLGQRLDASGIDFLEQCLKLDPHERITATQALAHPWLNDGSVPATSESKTTSASADAADDDAASNYSSDEEMEAPKPAAHKQASAAVDVSGTATTTSAAVSPSAPSASPSASVASPSTSASPTYHSPSSTVAGSAPAPAPPPPQPAHVLAAASTDASRKRSTQRRDSESGLAATEPVTRLETDTFDRLRAAPRFAPGAVDEQDDDGMQHMDMRALLRGEAQPGGGAGANALPKLGAQQQQRAPAQHSQLQPLGRGPQPQPRDVSPSGYSDSSYASGAQYSPQYGQQQQQQQQQLMYQNAQQQQYAQHLQDQAQQYVQQQHAAALAAQQAMMDARRLTNNGQSALLPQRAPPRGAPPPVNRQRRPSEIARGAAGPLPSLAAAPRVSGAQPPMPVPAGRWPGAGVQPPQQPRMVAPPQGPPAVRGQPPSVASFGMASNAYRRLAGPAMVRNEPGLSAVGLGVRLPALGR